MSGPELRDRLWTVLNERRDSDTTNDLVNIVQDVVQPQLDALAEEARRERQHKLIAVKRAEQAESERDRLREQLTAQQRRADAAEDALKTVESDITRINELWSKANNATIKLDMVRELVTMPHNAKNRLSSRVLSVLDMPDHPAAALDQGGQDATRNEAT